MKILNEYSNVLDINVFQKPIALKKIIFKLKKFLLRIMNQRTMILAYKLFKTYLKLSNISHPSIQFE